LLVKSAIPDGVIPAFAGLVSAVEKAPPLAEASHETVVDLLDVLGAVGDGRQERGRLYPVAAVLALAAGAVVAGIRSFTAIASWVSDVSASWCGPLYRRADPSAVATAPPSKSTIWRVLTGADTHALDAAIGTWLLAQAEAPEPAEVPVPPKDGDDDGEQTPLVAWSADGKALRGAKGTDGEEVRLLALMEQDKQLVIGQAQVTKKSNEIPAFYELLDDLQARGVDINDVVFTVDALHTQRKHARELHRRGADFVFQAKGNQPRLFAALDALDWAAVPIGHEQTVRGHGRIVRRTMQVLTAPDDLPFPHVQQVFLCERYVSDLHSKPLSAVAILGVTSLPAERAGTPALARLCSGQWAIEVLHFIRDTLYGEDASRARSGSGPRAMASLRNLAIGAHRPRRPHRDHRSHPLGQPLHGTPLQHPRPTAWILKRPCVVNRGVVG
jgi:predicted transposase YbfD/YdcC